MNPVQTTITKENGRNSLLDFARRTQDATPEATILIIDPDRPKGFVLETYRTHPKPIFTHHPEDELPEADLIIILK